MLPLTRAPFRDRFFLTHSHVSLGFFLVFSWFLRQELYKRYHLAMETAEKVLTGSDQEDWVLDKAGPSFVGLSSGREKLPPKPPKPPPEMNKHQPCAAKQREGE